MSERSNSGRPITVEIDGPDGIRITLDAREIDLDDPGQGTPAMVSLRVAGRVGLLAGTWACALDTGLVDEHRITAKQDRWLHEQEDRVHQFVVGHANDMREARGWTLGETLDEDDPPPPPSGGGRESTADRSFFHQARREMAPISQAEIAEHLANDATATFYWSYAIDDADGAATIYAHRAKWAAKLHSDTLKFSNAKTVGYTQRDVDESTLRSGHDGLTNAERIDYFRLGLCIEA